MQLIQFNIIDGNLGQVPASIANAVLHLGICANGLPNTVYAFGDVTTASATLGGGTLTENVADTVNVAGACLACPIKPSVAGSVGAVTHVGSGAGTVTPTVAPAVPILAKITTAGALGTMRVAFSVNGGAYGTPVLSTAVSFAMVVPGTQTTLTFSSQTYTLNDVWTFNVDGTSSISGAGTVSWVTQASSPLDAYDLFVTVTTPGALGTAQVTVSVDGNNGNSTSAPILVPGGGVYVVAGTGIVLTFASTFVAGDTYEALAVAAGFVGADMTAALTAAGNSTQKFILAHVAGTGSTSSAAASLAATMDTSMTAFAGQYRFTRGVIECPSTESDSTIFAAWASFASTRIMVCCGDVQHVSSLSGNLVRRNCALPIVSRLASTNPSVDPGWVGGGALKNVRDIYRNDGKLAYSMVTNRITSVTTIPTKQGYFSTTGVTMAPSGSDYASIMNCRVIDVACNATMAAVTPNLNQALLVDDRTGGIYDPEASKIEGFIVAQLGAALLQKSPPDASAVSATINRAENILQTGNFTVAIGVTPKGYAHKITVNIGFVNPAFTTV
jgi:hypothetical protein